MVEVPEVPIWQLYAFSAIGALLLWTKASITHKRIHGFGDLFEVIFHQSPRLQFVSVFFVFVLFGGFIGYVFVGPYSHLQALAGGVAWSRLAAKD